MLGGALSLGNKGNWNHGTKSVSTSAKLKLKTGFILDSKLMKSSLEVIDDSFSLWSLKTAFYSHFEWIKRPLVLVIDISYVLAMVLEQTKHKEVLKV